MDGITYIPIGIVHSPFTQPAGTPIQLHAAMGDLFNHQYGDFYAS
jgi:hypothetical protein